MSRLNDHNPESGRPTLAYWNTRGLAQSIRNLLIYKGVEFHDRRFEFGQPPDFRNKEWLKEKFTLGLTFPNLPYYIDGNVKLTQSLAILRHLARKYDLDGRTEEETTELDMCEQQARDLIVGLVMTGYSPNFEDARKKFEENLINVLELWANHLQGRKWTLGDRLTYVDFLLYEALDWNYELHPDAFEIHPELLDFLKNFEELPNIKEHMTTENYRKWPITSPMCRWGYRKA
ncbi:glutathione S-transferase Mu 4-like [Ixodes scapularis]|uniref:glutathione S-transferase Mu 4-like n=1 Tax=Ixodes scapularis TaxID=6945 RepID=UPI001A9EE036|nr:glutathione S-transferase Mu 4-like [Ixodes scapularis]